MIPPLQRDPRYRLLDACRGVACLMVVLHHAGFAVYFLAPRGAGGLEGWLRWGVTGALWRMNLGVAFFFVISGYCIAASADANRRRGLGPLSFLARRIWRIYPPYWAALLGFVAVLGTLESLGLERLYHGSGAVALQLDSPRSLEPAQWLGNLTLTEEWRHLVWHPPGRKVFTRIAWSLCYEEQFYFMTFLALLIAPARLYGTLAAVTLACALVRLAAADSGRLHLIEGSFPTLWHEFAVGLAVYWRLNVPASAGARRCVELLLVLLAAAGFARPDTCPIEYSTAAAAIFGLALIALRDRDEQAGRIAALAPLRACGWRCYSIYLVHLPVCVVGNFWLYERGLTGFWPRVLVMIPVVSAAAVAVSWAFFWAVERHFLNPPIVVRDPRRQPAALEPLAGEAARKAL